jgi:hypothetical protein
MEHFYARLTYKYHAGFAHLDDWEILGDAEVFYTKDEEDEYESRKSTALVLLQAPPTEEDKDKWLDAVREHFVHGCQCEHDCCGHYFGGAHKVTWYGDQAIRAELYSQPNI